MITDETDGVLKSLHTLLGQVLIIGIPENSERSVEGGDDIQNAMIAYVMEFGSPLHNVPARPFLVPGTEKAVPKMLTQLEQAAISALEKDIPQAKEYLNRAGLVGVQSVRNEMDTAAYEPLKPATVAARARARGEARSDDEEKYLSAIAAGIPAGVAQSMAGIKPLNNTGELRDAVTFSVKVVTL